MHERKSQWRFAVDRGGTFTDVIGLDPEKGYHTLKLLSNSPEYEDASTEGIRRLLGLPIDEPLPEDRIEAIRFGTTVTTNALLERKGGKVALFITRGFADLLEIGYQSRPDIFSLCIRKPAILYSEVIEVDERIDFQGNVKEPLDTRKLLNHIDDLNREDVDAVAVVFMHSWKNPEHELLCEDYLRKYGFHTVLLSHRTVNLVKIVSRGQSAVVDAYLSPVLSRYLERIKEATGRIPIEFMRSSGNLCDPDTFMGKDSIFSGPAGGVVAVAEVTESKGLSGVIGFDMGGTSTDVSRYDGEFERIYEMKIDGLELQTEVLNINTVASGGGSTLWFDGQKMRVGPQSAGAYPGPACYGFGGPLTITDANLVTGRIAAEDFPRMFGKDRRSPIGREISEEKFQQLTHEINQNLDENLTLHQVALGFLRIANEKMAMAIKEISVSKGYDVRNYTLLCFGGAGGQHACDVASLLGIKQIIVHPLSGVMSSYGIGLAKPAMKEAQTVLMTYNDDTHTQLLELFNEMENRISVDSSYERDLIEITRKLDIRTAGADTFFTVEYRTYERTIESFMERFKLLFGFYPEDGDLEVVNLRLEIELTGEFFPSFTEGEKGAGRIPVIRKMRAVHSFEGSLKAPVYAKESLAAGCTLRGPALIVDRYSTLVIDPDFEAVVGEGGTTVLTRIDDRQKRKMLYGRKPDPVLLEIFNNVFMGIAAEMGFTLRNAAHSVNIKERLDFSCALFDGTGALVANAPHIPVHLGSMADTVKCLLDDRKKDMKAGDIYLTNNPYKGGSHLPDITAVCPVFSEEGEIIFFTASRGHHADIGGSVPGSLPAFAEHIDDEGVLINNILIMRNGHLRDDVLLELFEKQKHPVRNRKERIADLKAQVAACFKGLNELNRIISSYGLETVKDYMVHIQDNAEFSVKKALSGYLGERETFHAIFEDFLDDGTRIKVKIMIHGGGRPPDTLRAVIDFTGTGLQHSNDNLNAPLSVTRSAILYVLRAITGTDIPLNSGCLKPIEVIVPESSILKPDYPAPVASGNMETSQRIVDVLLGALQVAGASQGTMNNLVFQIEEDTPYYETISGGSGAMSGCPGASGVQVHMTNTRITDPEILEYRHPGVRIEQFSLRRGSGGEGVYRGGDGVIRALHFLRPATVSVISERRRYAPYGMAGGGYGEKGENLLIKREGETIKLHHRAVIEVQEGDSLVIKTPGGGGYGRKENLRLHNKHNESGE